MISQFGDRKPESQCYFSRHLHSVGDLDIQFDPREFRSRDIKNSETTKSFRKYFGKKLRKLTYISQGRSDSYPYRYKTLKTLKVPLSSLPKIPILSIKTLKISTMEPFKKYKTIKKIEKVSEYKFLTSLELDLDPARTVLLKPIFFTHVGMLRYLTCLSIYLEERDITESFLKILQLNSLQSLSLQIRNRKRFLEFLEDIENKEKLIELYVAFTKFKGSYLGLDLSQSECVGSVESVTAFLKSFDQITIKSFYIKLKCQVDDLKRLEMFEASLDKVDLVDIDLRTIHVTCRTNAKNIFHPGTQPPRKLDLWIMPSMHSEFPKQTYKEKEPQVEPAESLTSLLREATGLTFPIFKTLNINHIQTADLRYPSDDEDPDLRLTPSLLRILRSSKALKHVILGGQPNDTDFSEIMKELASINQLESLVLELFGFENELWKTGLEELLISLPHLEKFTLYSRRPSSRPLMIKFPTASKLKELNVRLHNLESDDKKDFIRTIPKLEKLEKLSIQEGAQLFEDENYQQLFLQGLCCLSQLKEVHSISYGLRARKYFSEDKIKSVAKELDAQIKTMFKKIKTLEMFIFEISSKLDMKYIRY